MKTILILFIVFSIGCAPPKMAEQSHDHSNDIKLAQELGVSAFGGSKLPCDGADSLYDSSCDIPCPMCWIPRKEGTLDDYIKRTFNDPEIVECYGGTDNPLCRKDMFTYNKNFKRIQGGECFILNLEISKICPIPSLADIRTRTHKMKMEYCTGKPWTISETIFYMNSPGALWKYVPFVRLPCESKAPVAHCYGPGGIEYWHIMHWNGEQCLTTPNALEGGDYSYVLSNEDCERSGLKERE